MSTTTVLSDFTATVNPDNRIAVIACDTEDEVIIGASCTHIFDLPFPSTYMSDCKIQYGQGLSIILEKGLEDCTVDTESKEDHTILTLQLTPFDTLYFKDSVLDAYVQLKVFTSDNQLLYNERSKLKVTPTLESIEENENSNVQ